mgnify:CR=1 FL=1
MAKKEKVVEVNSSNQVVLDKSDTMGPWQIAWNRFRKNKIAMAGLIIFALIVLAGFFFFWRLFLFQCFPEYM